MKSLGHIVTIFYDSKYAAMVVQGLLVAAKNFLLVDMAKDCLSRVRIELGMKVNFVHVRSHKGDRGNEEADIVAANGSTGDVCMWRGLCIDFHQDGLENVAMEKQLWEFEIDINDFSSTQLSAILVVGVFADLKALGRADLSFRSQLRHLHNSFNDVIALTKDAKVRK